MTTNLQEKFTAQIVKNFTKDRTARDNRNNTASNKNAGNKFLKITTFPLMPMY